MRGSGIRQAAVISGKCGERFLPLSSTAASPLRNTGITLAGISTLKPPYEMGRPLPQNHLLLYTLSGSAELRFSERATRMKEGDLWLIPINRPHHYILDRKQWNIFWFHLGDSAQWEHLKKQKARVITRRYDAGRILEAMEGMIFEGLHRASGWEENLGHFADILSTYISRILSSEENPADRRIRFELGHLWEKVNADISRNWTVKELADHLFISEPQLYRYTEKYCGSSPLAMVTKLRMQYARSLLLHTDEPLYLIAEKTGYSTPFAFSKAFKRYSGKSPREFRKSN